MTTLYQVERRRVAAAIDEARAFVLKAQNFLDSNTEAYPSRRRSAMKRASLDLSAALVLVRRPIGE